jgi:Thiol:disulfide interchange protein DsbD, N-terminal
MAAAALAACLYLPSLWAQGSPIITVETQKVAVKRGASAETRIAVSVPPGFHVNSSTPSDSYLIPLRLTWTPGALEADGITFPKPSMEKYEFSDKPLSVYTGKVDLLAKFKAPANAPLGPGVLVGKLRYQACNDRSCFAPKSVEVRLPYQIQ